jgi:hypothetical protein
MCEGRSQYLLRADDFVSVRFLPPAQISSHDTLNSFAHTMIGSDNAPLFRFCKPLNPGSDVSSPPSDVLDANGSPDKSDSNVSYTTITSLLPPSAKSPLLPLSSATLSSPTVTLPGSLPSPSGSLPSDTLESNSGLPSDFGLSQAPSSESPPLCPLAPLRLGADIPAIVTRVVPSKPTGVTDSDGESEVEPDSDKPQVLGAKSKLGKRKRQLSPKKGVATSIGGRKTKKCGPKPTVPVMETQVSASDKSPSSM